MLEALQISDGKSQAVFVFVLLVLMKKINNYGIRNGCFCCPFLKLFYSYYYLHIPMNPYLFLPWFSLHSVKKYFSALYGGKLEGTTDSKGIIWDVLVDEKPYMTWQLLAAQKTNSILDSVKRSVASREGR